MWRLEQVTGIAVMRKSKFIWLKSQRRKRRGWTSALGLSEGTMSCVLTYFLKLPLYDTQCITKYQIFGNQRDGWMDRLGVGR